MKEKNQRLVNAEEKFELVTKEQVKQHICKDATEQEIAYFLQIAKLNKLNPFKREIYLVKYQGSPASTLTGYEVYLKRAERTGNYNGFKIWTEGEGDKIVAKIEVYRKDWPKPLCHEVEYSEYVGKKKDGSITKFWKKMPKTMLKKVVISQGMRLAFPDELGGMPHTRDESSGIIDAETTETPSEEEQMPKAKSEHIHPISNIKEEPIPAEEDPAKNAYKEMLLRFRKARDLLGDEKYYKVLTDVYGYKHANEIRCLDVGDEVLVELRRVI